MGWLTTNDLLPYVTKRYLASAIGPMEYFFFLLGESKRPLNGEKEAVAVIANCEAFAAVSSEPSAELNLAEVGTPEILFQRTLWNVDLLALQSLEFLGSCPFFKEEWRSDFADLKRRLEKISARYEDHRQNPGRGVSTYDPATGEWVSDDQKNKS